MSTLAFSTLSARNLTTSGMSEADQRAEVTAELRRHVVAGSLMKWSSITRVLPATVSIGISG